MKSTPINVYRDEKLITDYGLGVWETHGKKVWGLTEFDLPAWPYAYYLDNVIPQQLILTRQAKFENPPHVEDKYHSDWLLWYFDVGAKLWVTLDDLAVAFSEIGIWNGNR